MPSFRRVAGAKAGPTALGILIPPGQRTVVLVRPRALDWDLLLLKPGGDGFWEMTRGDAAAMVQKVHQALQECAAGDSGKIELVPRAEGAGYLVRVFVPPFTWLVCGRRPGQAYRPVAFADEQEAQTVADRLAEILCPGTPQEQEIYFNTLHFAR
jgi:hypothetical protein